MRLQGEGGWGRCCQAAGGGPGLEEGTQACGGEHTPGGVPGLLWPRAGSEVVRRGATLDPGCRWAGGSVGSLREGDSCSSAQGLWALGGWGGGLRVVSVRGGAGEVSGQGAGSRFYA